MCASVYLYVYFADQFHRLQIIRTGLTLHVFSRYTSDVDLDMSNMISV